NNQMSTADRSYQFTRGRSDEAFITDHCIDMNEYDGVKDYIAHRLKKMLGGWENLPEPSQLKFRKVCLEFQLEKRLTDYQLAHDDEEEGIQVALAVSGAGKTRMMLELLYQRFGYFFVYKSSQPFYFSTDLQVCSNLCNVVANNNEEVKNLIQLLFLVRGIICQILIEHGYKEPWQILYAQLHPSEIFGDDAFQTIYSRMYEARYGFGVKLKNSFKFAIIDEIQIALKEQE
ncbi:hypothetical protein MP638_000799, partial [Amoeboaphelidium occidentale]